jgi:hypothetical protein
MTMLNHDLKGRDSKPAEGLSGRIYALDEKNAKALLPETMSKKTAQWGEIAKAGSQFPQWAGSEVGKLKEKIPEFNGLAARAIAKSVANEYAHFQDVLVAKSRGAYREFPAPDGTTERGIVSGEGADLKREGLWIQKDQDGRVREIGSFKDGQPNGAFREYRQDGSLSASAYFKEGVQTGVAYQYNEKSEPILKTEFEGGKAKEPITIDPVAVKKEKAERQADWQAQQSFTLAR